MTLKSKFMGATAGVTMLMAASAASALDEITVAYFLEWPTPNQFAQADGTFSEMMGVKVNWVSFDAGTAMSAAMASGDVHISYSQGVTPFLVATAAGQDLQIVDVAMSYSENDNCVVRADLEIDADNVAAELPGKQVGVPLGTAAHSGFLAQMEHFGIDTNSLKIVDMTPVDSAAAFAAGELDMVCGWGGPLRRMKEYGNTLLSGAEKEAVVGRVFDVTSIPTSFGEEHPDLVSKFIEVTAALENQYRAEGDAMLPNIAQAAGMDEEGAKAVLSVFVFPTVEEKLGNNWMAAGVAEYLTSSAASLEAKGQLTALDDYSAVVNSSFLEAASKM